MYCQVLRECSGTGSHKELASPPAAKDHDLLAETLRQNGVRRVNRRKPTSLNCPWRKAQIDERIYTHLATRQVGKVFWQTKQWGLFTAKNGAEFTVHITEVWDG